MRRNTGDGHDTTDHRQTTDRRVIASSSGPRPGRRLAGHCVVVVVPVTLALPLCTLAILFPGNLTLSSSGQPPRPLSLSIYPQAEGRRIPGALQTFVGNPGHPSRLVLVRVA